MTRETAENKAEYQANRDRKPQAVVKSDRGFYLAGPIDQIPSDLRNNVEKVVEPRS